VTEPAAKRVPTIPLLIFAAVDLVLAFLLLLDTGFSVEFWLIAAIGVVLAVLGLRGVGSSH
jgi:hypothetical protein